MALRALRISPSAVKMMASSPARVDNIEYYISTLYTTLYTTMTMTLIEEYTHPPGRTTRFPVPPPLAGE
jgi:hypothetical protein